MFGRYHGKGAFIASININAKFTLGRKITGIFRLVHVHFKKENGDILGNTFMSSIGDRLKNICDGCFLGCTHEDKKQFIILPHGCPLPPPRAKKICNTVRSNVLVT